MKNLYILLIVASIFAMSKTTFSQDIIILDENMEEVTNGEIYLYGEPTDFVIKAQMFFQNTSDVDLPVLLRKVEVEIFPGTLNSFCWNGSCLSDQVFEVNEPIILEAGATSRDTDFYAEYFPEGFSATSIIRYEFFAPDNEFETVGVTVHYITGDDDENGDDNGDDNGSTNITAFNKDHYSFESMFPNPANLYTKVKYSTLVDAGNITLRIMSITGALIKEESLNPSSSSHVLDTSSFSRGVYMVSLFADGKLIATRKLLISN